MDFTHNISTYFNVILAHDAIQQTNHYPVDNAIDFPNTYLLDSDLSAA